MLYPTYGTLNNRSLKNSILPIRIAFVIMPSNENHNLSGLHGA